MRTNPRLNQLKAEATSLRGGCEYLDALAAAENRALSADEQTSYDAALTRMEAIGAEVEATKTRQEKLDDNAAVLAQLGGADPAPELVRGVTPSAPGSIVQVHERRPVDACYDLGTYALVRGQVLHGSKTVEEGNEVLTRTLQHGVAADGTAPVTIEGDLINFVDANRYAVNAARKLPMPDNHAPTFKRPRVTQRTQVGNQAAEGDVLSSRRLQLTGDTVTKRTEGGVLSLSEQEIDWTDPAMLGLAIQDLAEQYAIDTDDVLTTAIEAGITSNKTTLADDASLVDFTPAFAEAVGAVYTAAKRMANVVFASVDRWVYLNGLTDADGRPAFPTVGPQNAPGSNGGGQTSLGNLSISGIPVVVDPNFSSGTLIVAASSLVEFYEQNKGLLSIAAPSTLEVQYAYRGYVAANVYAAGLQALTDS